MPLSIGDKLGPYELLSLIGKGGMGAVWKARDSRLDRTVAIKFCEQEFSGRFLREARAIASLNHPNICTLHDIGPDFLVMEFIEGAPPGGPLAPPEAIHLALGIAAALEAAHDRGITHRDLKPANILVTRSGIKLLDFGLALVNDDPDGDSREDVTRVMANATVAGSLVGTAGYMSPEQAQGKPADSRSDIFSFGLVFYEILSGRRAFTGGSAMESIAAILRDEPSPLDAPPALSEIVARCLRKTPAERFQTMREVGTALKEALLTLGAGPVSTPVAPPASVSTMASIAVLPFANISADKDNEYFSDGLAEEILNMLSKIPDLRVIARTSSFAFRGEVLDIRKIGQVLGVQTILQGSVRRNGNRIRVTAQLIDAATGAQRWSERYDGDMTDVFAVQDEIGKAISESLKVELAPHTKTVNIEVWHYYLKAQYYQNRLTPESMAKGKECCEQALAIDPGFAPAYGKLSELYYAQAVLGIKTNLEVAPLTKTAATRALAIDPADGVANSVLAVLAASADYDWKAAETLQGRAMAAKPVLPIVRYRHVMWYLLPLGRFDAAVAQSRLALENDPLSPILQYGAAWSLYYAGRYAEVMAFVQKAMEINPDHYLLWGALGIAQLRTGAMQESISSLKRATELAPWFPGVQWLLAMAYALAGMPEKGKELAQQLTGASHNVYWAALYFAAAGAADEMFEALEGAYRDRDWGIIMMPREVLLEPWRADPRFHSLLQRINLE